MPTTQSPWLASLCLVSRHFNFPPSTHTQHEYAQPSPFCLLSILLLFCQVATSCNKNSESRVTKNFHPSTAAWLQGEVKPSYPMRSCSMASIFSARAITRLIISFSSSVSSSCFLCLSVCAPGWTDHPACSLQGKGEGIRHVRSPSGQDRDPEIC